MRTTRVVVAPRLLVCRTALSTLTRRYEAFVAATAGGCDDPVQRHVVAKFEALSAHLAHHSWGAVRPTDHWVYTKLLPAWVGARRAPQGLYLCGSVGTGKTALMDLFINSLLDDHNHVRVVADGMPPPVESGLREGGVWRGRASWAVRRTHFHRFMLDVHARLHRLRQAAMLSAANNGKKGGLGDPLLLVAAELAAEAPLLCFDEFQVTDVADAAILHRLFEGLFAHGAVVVATSNRKPKDLYEGGINRFLFVPCVKLLEARCSVVDLVAVGAQRDYREWSAAVAQETSSSEGSALSGHPRLFLHGAADDAAVDAEFNALFAHLADSSAAVDAPAIDSGAVAAPAAAAAVAVAHGRTLAVPEEGEEHSAYEQRNRECITSFICTKTM